MVCRGGVAEWAVSCLAGFLMDLKGGRKRFNSGFLLSNLKRKKKKKNPIKSE